MKCRKQAILLVSTMLFTIFIATNSFANIITNGKLKQTIKEEKKQIETNTILDKK